MELIRFCVCGLVLIMMVNAISADRVLNITLLENCRDPDMQEAEVIISETTYHIVPETGLCDTVHGEFAVKAGEPGPRILTMTLYRCPNGDLENNLCKNNPTEHVEILDCKRMTDDDSGPWAMFADAIQKANCGKDIGTFSMDYSTLKLNHLMNYLDIHDTGFAQYRLRLVYVGQTNNQLRACIDMDFQLVNA